MVKRMSGAQRRTQILELAAVEFADRGFHGASLDTVAQQAGISQPYIFRMFGTKKKLFLELVEAAFDRVTQAMLDAAEGLTGTEALGRMGWPYYHLLADRTNLLLQLQAFAACGDEEVRDAVRGCFARMWDAVADTTGADPVTVKSFLAYGMLLNTGAALDVDDVDEPWANGIRTRIHGGLFDHITAETNQAETNR